MYDILIIGAGPAGLTAAIYARRALKKVLVLEASVYGGQIINTLDIENYPGIGHISGFEFATKLYEQANDLGCEFVFEKAIDILNYVDYKEVVTDKNHYKTKTVIIATGADNRKLGIDREDDFIGHGLSYCATCDGNFYKCKDVCVIGGGNTALEDAIYLSGICNKVYLIHRRNEFRAFSSLVAKAESIENINIILNSNVSKLNGSNSIESIDIVDGSGLSNNIQTQGVFVAIGKNPSNQNFSKIIELDDNGYIISNEKCNTNVDGIYVAGDNRVKELRQLVTATSDGAIAATEAINYINNK